MLTSCCQPRLGGGVYELCWVGHGLSAVLQSNNRGVGEVGDGFVGDCDAEVKDKLSYNSSGVNVGDGSVGCGSVGVGLVGEK